MAKKKSARSQPAKAKTLKDIKARSNEAALERAQRVISRAIKDSDLDVKSLATKSGISTATARSLLAGNIRDVKLHTLARVFPVVGLQIAEA